MGSPITVDRDIIIKKDSKCNHCEPKFAKELFDNSISLKKLLFLNSQNTIEYESIERIWSTINLSVKDLKKVSKTKRVNKVI